VAEKLRGNSTLEELWLDKCGILAVGAPALAQYPSPAMISQESVPARKKELGLASIQKHPRTHLNWGDGQSGNK
jgi:hypothetical protein